jgi:hypothetical protein
MFNDQQLINMNQEKARKYIGELETWLDGLKKLEMVAETSTIPTPDLYESGGGGGVSSGAAKSASSFIDSACSLSVDSNYESNTDCSSSCVEPCGGGGVVGDSSLLKTRLTYTNDELLVSIDNLKHKKLGLKKSLASTSAQIRSLSELFEKRLEQLRRSALPTVTTIGKPVQRVEPQPPHHQQLQQQQQQQKQQQQNQVRHVTVVEQLTEVDMLSSSKTIANAAEPSSVRSSTTSTSSSSTQSNCSSQQQQQNHQHGHTTNNLQSFLQRFNSSSSIVKRESINKV